MNFVSDDEHTRQMLAAAREHDEQTTCAYTNGATTPEGSYVQEFVPEADGGE